MHEDTSFNQDPLCCHKGVRNRVVPNIIAAEMYYYKLFTNVYVAGCMQLALVLAILPF